MVPSSILLVLIIKLVGHCPKNMIKVSAVEFMQNNPVRKRVSVLEPFRTEILKLKDAGYSVPQILEFLKVNNIEVSKTALISFINVRTKSLSAVSHKNINSGATKVNSRATTNNKPQALAADKVQNSSMKPEKYNPQLVEKNGHVIDVNYKPSWVDDDINLKDLI